MIIQNLVVTGLLKAIRSLKTNELITEDMNGVTRQEISHLSGLTSNIQEQIQTTNTSILTAQTEQTQWKSDIANAINDIPNPANNNNGLASTTEKSKFINNLNNIKNNIKSATASAADVVKPAKFIDADGNIVVGNLEDRNDYTDAISSAIGPENRLYVRIPTGAYRTPTQVNYPEIRVSNSQLCQATGLSAAKILKGQSVAGINGTATDDSDATAGHILKDKTAYVKGNKITGSMKNWEGEPDHVLDARIQNNRFEFAVHAGYHGWSWTRNSYEYMTFTEVSSLIGLTAGKLLKGNTVLGLAGTATGDANASAAQILKDKIAYVNGGKVTGTMPSRSRSTKATKIGHNATNTYFVFPFGYYPNEQCFSVANSSEVYAANADIASVIGLTPEKIKFDEVVLGVTGTYDNYGAGFSDGYKSGHALGYEDGKKEAGKTFNLTRVNNNTAISTNERLYIYDSIDFVRYIMNNECTVVLYHQDSDQLLGITIRLEYLTDDNGSTATLDFNYEIKPIVTSAARIRNSYVYYDMIINGEILYKRNSAYYTKLINLIGHISVCINNNNQIEFKIWFNHQMDIDDVEDISIPMNLVAPDSLTAIIVSPSPL